MKNRLLRSLVALLLLAVAFMAGRWVERAMHGYHYQVIREKQIESTPGPIHWKYVSETVGYEVLDPGTTLIEVDGRLLYKAKRGFQASAPFADNITVNNGLIEWDDGEYSFSLRMQKLPPGTPVTRPGTAPANQALAPPTNQTQGNP